MPFHAGSASRPGEVAGLVRLLVWVMLALVLMFLDQRSGWLEGVRRYSDVATRPFWTLAGLPGKLVRQTRDDAGTRTRLRDENRNLRNELLIANAKLARFSTVADENQHLRALMGMVESRGLEVQLVPILDIDLEPTRRRLVLDAGRDDGVVTGQAVIDESGLIGQVVQVSASSAVVLLLTDTDHAVPVMISRNGVRLLAYGRGRSDALELVNVPLNADVQVGDEVLTSGLGGRFPAGFPVGTVARLRHDDSHSFLVGELTPAARLDRGRDVLLLRLGEPVAVPASVAALAAGRVRTLPATAASASAPARAEVKAPAPVPAPAAEVNP